MLVIRLDGGVQTKVPSTFCCLSDPVLSNLTYVGKCGSYVAPGCLGGIFEAGGAKVVAVLTLGQQRRTAHLPRLQALEGHPHPIHRQVEVVGTVGPIQEAQAFPAFGR